MNTLVTGSLTIYKYPFHPLRPINSHHFMACGVERSAWQLTPLKSVTEGILSAGDENRVRTLGEADSPQMEMWLMACPGPFA
jgi:hypothetical protein